MTTGTFYARWIPVKGRRWVEVEVLDTPGANLEPEVEPKRLFGEGGAAEVRDSEWSRRWDLNPRPADYESAALPLSYTGFSQSRHYVVATAKGTTSPRVVKSVGEFWAIRSTASALCVGERCV